MAHWRPRNPSHTGIDSIDRFVAVAVRRGWYVHRQSYIRNVVRAHFQLGFNRDDTVVEIELAFDSDDGPNADHLLRFVENAEIGEIVRERPDLMAEVENELALRALARLGTPD